MKTKVITAPIKLNPVKVFSPGGFQEYCERRNVKKITFSSGTEEYDVFDFPIDYKSYQDSHYCMLPFSIVEMEFTEVRSDWLYGDESGDLYLSCDTCQIILNNVKRIELYNTWGKADMIMVYTCEDETTPERVFLFGLQYK